MKGNAHVRFSDWYPGTWDQELLLYDRHFRDHVPGNAPVWISSRTRIVSPVRLVGDQNDLDYLS